MAEIGVMKKLTIGGSTYTIPEYSLPIASASTLGGVKIGTGLTINSTTGVLSATGLDFDEADPVFTASAAYGITSTDITNWNSKTSNTGTITKVQTSAGAHTIVNVSSGNVSFNVPTKTSHLTNDSGFLTSSDLASVLKYKGTKASVANLPTTGNTTGDVWHITADGSEYAWDGSIWQELGTAVDLSGYVPTSRTINSKALSSDISLTYGDVGAAASSHTHGNITNDGDITATAPTIANGDQIIINDNSASKITNGPTFDGSTTTTALTPKGTWESFSKFSGSYADLTDKPTIPTDTNTWRTIQVNDSDILGSGIDTGKLNLKAGTNVSITNSGGTVTISATDTNTDEKLKWTASTSSNTYYPLQSTSTATTSTANTLNSVSFYQYYNTAGGYRRFILGNATAYTSSGGAYGTIRLYGTGATYYGDLNPGTIGANSLTENRTWTLPDKTGIIALTSDIPTVPTNVSAFTNDAGYITDSDIPEGASAYTGTPSAVSTSAATGSSNAFARGDHVHNITSSTITSALGYTPYNSTNPNGYITASHTSTYSLPLAASGTRGGVQIGYSESGTNYAVKLSSEKMYVTVPWTDTKVTTAALTSGTTYYPILATGTGTATRQIDSTLGGLKYISTAGSTSAVGTAILHLGNSTASGSSNNEQGVLRIYTVNTRYVDVKTESTFTPTGSRNRYLPSYDADMYLTGTNTTDAVGGATTAPVYVDNTGCIQAVTSIPYSLLTGTPTIPTVPASTGSSETGVTASTTATRTTLGTASSIYGVKSGTNSTTTASKASGSNGSASTWVFEDVACDDITAWSAGSGSASFTATVSSHVLSFSLSHTHTAPSLTYSAKTASHVKSGGNGTAPSWSFSDVTVPIRNDSATSVPNVSVASATVTISDPGHTHTI